MNQTLQINYNHLVFTILKNYGLYSIYFLGGEFSYSGGKNNGGVNDRKDLFLETMGPKLSHCEDLKIVKSPYLDNKS
jgi:hypothetical protein